MARVRYSAAVTFLPEVERAVDGIRALLASPSIGRIQPHITLVPPGEATPSELDALLFELAGIASTTAPFDLRLGGLGIFPNRRTIGYLRVEDVDGVLVPIGTALGRGHRDFVPHVTVAEAAPRDLLEQVHALEAAPPSGTAAGPAVTRASLQADLLAAHERAIRLNARVQQLERRLSEALGEQAWRESGLGAPPDIDALTAKITQAEQEAADLRIKLADRDDELAAARAANRELMTRINHEPKTR